MCWVAQLEAPQFEAALELFREHPTVPIVLNHLGCPSVRGSSFMANFFTALVPTVVPTQ